MEIYFVSSNDFKHAEVNQILVSKSYKIISYCPSYQIKELQSKDLKEIVTDKVLKAFDMIHRPVIVEHTGLFLKEFNGFPGGLTQIFWDSIEADNFSKYFGNMRATAKTIVAFCDGTNILFFDGAIDGRIVDKPSENRKFHWDCVFQPDKFDKTFAEMGDTKNDISMRKIALEKLKSYLEDHYGRI